jgi:hypothetical protein
MTGVLGLDLNWLFRGEGGFQGGREETINVRLPVSPSVTPNFRVSSILTRCHVRATCTDANEQLKKKKKYR